MKSSSKVKLVAILLCLALPRPAPTPHLMRENPASLLRLRRRKRLTRRS